MTDTITLPRAVGEQIRAALVSGEKLFAALAALDAALAEPEQGNCADGSCNCCWTDKPDAKREPATEEVIEAKFEKSFYVHPEALDDFAEGWCEAERFHGIRKEDKP